MKKLILIATMATASIGSSFAANLSTNSADIFLGFDTLSGIGAGKSLVIDLGTLSTVISNLGNQIDLSGSSSILSTTYGTDWFTRTDLSWGVFGGNTSTYFLLSTANQSPAFDGSPNGDGGYIYNADRSQETLAFNAVSAQHGLGTLGTVTGTKGSALNYGLDTGNSGSFNTGSFGDQFDNGAFNGTFGSLGIPFFDGSSYTSLDVYKYVKNNDTKWYSEPAMSFNVGISPAGVITVVPEPSTYALIGLGLVAVVSMRCKFSKVS